MLTRVVACSCVQDALSGVIAAGTTDGSDAAVMEAAIEWLRKKGISTAAKKSGRVASEGLVALQSTAGAASLVEVNSETDFAAKNDLFKALCASVSDAALTLAKGAAPRSNGELDLASLQSASCADPTASAQVPVSAAVVNVVSTLRENVQVRRVAGLRVSRGVVGAYVHNAVLIEEGKTDPHPQVRLGRQASIVSLEVEGGSEPTEELQSLANKLAMQVVASVPRFVSRAEVPAAMIDAEKAIIAEQANAAPIHVPGQPQKKASKPKDAAQMARMVDGKINKWMSEIVLLEQPFVVAGGEEDAKPQSVQAVLDAESKKIGGKISVHAFQRFLVGEGVASNKGADSFAKEVAEKLAKAK